MMDPELFAYMEAHDDDDAPDGAWWAKLEDAVRSWNTDHSPELDPFDTVHEYLKARQEVDGE